MIGAVLLLGRPERPGIGLWVIELDLAGTAVGVGDIAAAVVGVVAAAPADRHHRAVGQQHRVRVRPGHVPRRAWRPGGGGHVGVRRFGGVGGRMERAAARGRGRVVAAELGEGVGAGWAAGQSDGVAVLAVARHMGVALPGEARGVELPGMGGLRPSEEHVAAGAKGEGARIQPEVLVGARLLVEGALSAEGGRRVEDLECFVLDAAGRHVAEAAGDDRAAVREQGLGRIPPPLRHGRLLRPRLAEGVEGEDRLQAREGGVGVVGESFAVDQVAAGDQRLAVRQLERPEQKNGAEPAPGRRGRRRRSPAA